MNRTRSDSRYLELESSTHCNSHEAESGSPYALKLIHHAQQKVPFSFCLPSSSPSSIHLSFSLVSLLPNVPLFSLSIIALITRIIFSSFAFGSLRPGIKIIHFIQFAEYLSKRLHMFSCYTWIKAAAVIDIYRIYIEYSIINAFFNI